MNKPQSSADAASNTQLYLVIPPETLDTSPQFTAKLTQLVADVRVAAVLLCPPENSNLDAAALHPVVSQLQKHGLAVMIQDDVNLAKSVTADGVHLTWRTAILEAYGQARAELGETAMIGADAGKSRHDAMVLGERGADYIAFGVPVHVKDQQTSRNRQIDLVSWWADVFEIPVVAADIRSEPEFQAMFDAGADFVAATLPPHSIDQPECLEFITELARHFPAPVAKS